MWHLRLSYRYWQHHPWWLLSTVVSIAVTVGLAFAAGQLFAMTRATYKTLVVQPLGSADLQLVATDDEGMFAVWQNVLKDLPGLEVVAPVLSRQTVVIYNGKRANVQVHGVENAHSLLYPLRLVEGRTLLNGDTGSVVISSTLAQNLKIKVGETLELVSPRGFRSFSVVGLSNEELNIVRAPFAATQLLFTSGNYVDGFDLRLTPGVEQKPILQLLEERFHGVATVMTPKERVSPIRQVLMSVWVVVLALLGGSVLIMFCLLLSFLGATKSLRAEETTALYIFGVSQPQLRRWRVLELNTLVVAASFFGLLIAAAFTYAQQARLHQLSFVAAALTTFFIMATVILFFYAQVPETSFKREQLWLRRLPMRLWLAWQLLRQLGRSYWLGVVILTLALTGLTSTEIIVRVQQRSLHALMTTLTEQHTLTERQVQIQEEFPLEGSFSQSTRWNMAMMPGVAFISSYLTKVTMEERLEEDLYVLDFAAFPYQSYLRSTEGVEAKALAETLHGERTLAISQSLAESYDLKTGMNVRLHTPRGPHRYKIVAVLEDMGGVSRAMFIDRQTYLEDWGRSSEGLFLISFEETLRPQQVASLVQEHLNGRYKGLSWTAISFKSELEQLVTSLLTGCRWLMMLFVFIAVLSLRHALSSPVSQQLIATLYLLGSQRRFLTQLGPSAIFLTTLVVVVIAFSLGTSLSYWLVASLHHSGSYWVWQLSGLSYSLSSVVVLISLAILSKASSKHAVFPPR
jgi:ABC-type lipoprotein release transport system permease subunit